MEQWPALKNIGAWSHWRGLRETSLFKRLGHYREVGCFVEGPLREVSLYSSRGRSRVRSVYCIIIV